MDFVVAPACDLGSRLAERVFFILPLFVSGISLSCLSLVPSYFNPFILFNLTFAHLWFLIFRLVLKVIFSESFSRLFPRTKNPTSSSLHPKVSWRETILAAPLRFKSWSFCAALTVEAEQRKVRKNEKNMGNAFRKNEKKFVKKKNEENGENGEKSSKTQRFSISFSLSQRRMRRDMGLTPWPTAPSVPKPCAKPSERHTHAKQTGSKLKIKQENSK